MKEIFAIFCIALGSIISLVNLMIIYQSWKKKEPVFAIPGIGAFLLWFGLAHFESTRDYAHLCMFTDYYAVALIVAAPRLVRIFWVTNRFNLLRTFVGHTKCAEYTLELYRKGIFVIKAELEPPQIAGEHGAMILGFGLQGKWEDIDGVIQLTEYSDDNRMVRIEQTDDKYLITENNYPEEKEYKYDMLNGIEFVLVK